MTPKEQEIAIQELEERLDRLRNIYEQYFLGFERLEPMVPRKDVDRRFALLRKEQIHNTALRFRFNMLTQKFNTYATQWVRVCRQIEEGTYKRHVQRAKARFGDTPASQRSREERDLEVDLSVDIDLDEEFNVPEASDNADDFDQLLDQVLAEATDAAELRARQPRPDAPITAPAPHAERALASTPNSMASPGSDRTLPSEVRPATPPESDRAARPVAFPAGAKPRIIRKRDAPGIEPLSDTRRSDPRLGPATAFETPSQPFVPVAAPAPGKGGSVPTAIPPGAVPPAPPPAMPTAPGPGPGRPAPAIRPGGHGVVPIAPRIRPIAPRSQGARETPESAAVVAQAIGSLAPPASSAKSPPSPSGTKLPPAPSAPKLPPSPSGTKLPPASEPTMNSPVQATPRAPQAAPSMPVIPTPADSRPSLKRLPLPLPTQVVKPSKKE